MNFAKQKIIKRLNFITQLIHNISLPISFTNIASNINYHPANKNL